MPGFALLMLQAASTVTTPTPDERLLHPVPPRHCEGSAGEIVVCAHDQDAYRLHGSGPQIEPTLPRKAEWRLFGNAKMNIHGEQRSLPGVGSAPAAMVTVTVPF
ncbi:hypothetical protein [Sphingomonas oryzagri]